MKASEDESCLTENWISIEGKARLHRIGNRMCEYAHLKVIQLEYNVKVNKLLLSTKNI